MRLCIVFLMCAQILHAQSREWTWFLRVCGKDFACEIPLTYQRIGLKPFTQLITSWNGRRPDVGSYVFKVRVRNAATQKWMAWHTMFSWGARSQHSFESRAVDGTKYLHVRLEMPKHTVADGFEIKVEPRDGAHLEDLHALAVSLSNMRMFEPESSRQLARNLSSVAIRGVPRYSQMVLDHEKAHVMCSTTSSSMLASYITEECIDPLQFAECAYDYGMQAYGSWPFNTAHAYEICEGRAHIHVQRLHSFAELHQLLQKHIPVVVSVRGTLQGAPKSYPHGHLLIVVGYDAKHKKVICHDPAVLTKARVLKKYDLTSFLAACERSHRLAYVAYPLHEGDQCFVDPS